MVHAFAALAAVVPSLLLLWFFTARDTYREPPKVIWTTFALGAFAILPLLLVVLPIMLVLEGTVGSSPVVLGVLRAFLSAAIPEEAFKLMVLALYAGRRSAFDEPMDGVVYGVAASLGFATLENVLYCVEGGPMLALMRAVSAVPMHAGCGVMMGYYYGRSRFEPAHRGRLLGLAYVLPMLLHGLYDVPMIIITLFARSANRPPGIVAVGLFCIGTFFVLVAAAGSLIIVRRARKEQKDRGPPVPLPPPAPAAPKIATRASTLAGFGLVLGGGLAACCGALFALAAAVSPPATTGTLIAVLVMFGGIPIAMGFGSFGVGVRLLNRPRRPPEVLG